MRRREALLATASVLSVHGLLRRVPCVGGGDPLIVMTVGDSRTATGDWQEEFARLAATYAGVTLDIRNVAVGGVDTMYWSSRIAGLLAAHEPDMVTFYTGTNDDPNAVIYGEPQTSWAWRYTVETIRNYRTPAPVIVPAFVQYSDPILAPQSLLDSEPRTNDHIYVEYIRHQPWFPGIADFQKIPSTGDYLAADPYQSPPGTIGIHPNRRGYKCMGRITYDTVALALGWPVNPEPPLVGMYGHKKGYGRPNYIPVDRELSYDNT